MFDIHRGSLLGVKREIGRLARHCGNRFYRKHLMRLTHHHKQRGTRLGALLTSLVALLTSLGGGQLALAQTEPLVIQDIRVEGLQRISPGSVFAALPVGVGDTVDTFAVRAAAKSLFASGNFDDISIARDGGVLVVVVAERPSISEITIDGN